MCVLVKIAWLPPCFFPSAGEEEKVSWDDATLWLGFPAAADVFAVAFGLAGYFRF